MVGGKASQRRLTVTVTRGFGSKCLSFPLEPSLLHVLAPSEWHHFFPSDCPWPTASLSPKMDHSTFEKALLRLLATSLTFHLTHTPPLVLLGLSILY